MGRGELSGRSISRKRQRQRWLKKTWKRKSLRLKDKYDPIEGSPMAKGIVIEKKALEQKQPHSGLIKCVKIQLVKNGKFVTAFDSPIKPVLESGVSSRAMIAWYDEQGQRQLRDAGNRIEQRLAQRSGCRRDIVDDHGQGARGAVVTAHATSDSE